MNPLQPLIREQQNYRLRVLLGTTVCAFVRGRIYTIKAPGFPDELLILYRWMITSPLAPVADVYERFWRALQ